MRYESTPLDVLICLVDSVRLSIKVREVVVVGVYKMSSSRVKSLRVDTTRLRNCQVDRVSLSIKAVFVVVVVGV